MRVMSSLAAAAILLCMPAGFALAQNAPSTETPAAPAGIPAPPAATPAAPAAAPAAPAATSASPASAATPTTQQPTTQQSSPTAPSANTPSKTATENATKPKKKKTAKMSRRQEIEKSIENGTVPSRYRSAVPKEYQHYIPFSKD